MENNSPRVIPESELIINEDGTIFHLHLLSSQLKDRVILVGDPGRVQLIASMFDTIECSGSNREYKWCSGTFQGKEITILSTGVGCGNIDIVMTELDALANVDFATRTRKATHRTLSIVRIGTSGTVQGDISLGDAIVSRFSIGIDSVPLFYSNYQEVCNSQIAEDFIRHTSWPQHLSTPYCVEGDNEIISRFTAFAREGITLTAPGFYAAQGRYVRLKPIVEQFLPSLITFNHKIEAKEQDVKEVQNIKITNIEMESSTLTALAKMLGHKSATICIAIAQRKNKDVSTDYQYYMTELVKKVLKNI